MIKRIKNLLGTEFARNVLTLMTGTVIGQAVALLLSPIVTRLFTPENFTTLELYTMLLNVLVVVATGKYEFAIMQPKDREDARLLVSLTVRIAFFSSLSLMLILLFSSGWIASYYQNPDLKKWLWTLPFCLFAFAVFSCINFWFGRLKNFKVAATSKVWNSAASEPVKIATGLMSWSSGGLILATLFGNISSAIYSFKKFIEDEPLGITKISKKRMKELAIEYSDYPRYTIWGSIFSRLAQWAHIGMFSHFYGIYAVGYMALCRRVFMTPLNIISGSYGQVFYQRISEISDNRSLYKFYMKNLYRFLAFAGLCLVAVLLLPYGAMGFVFGEEWTKAIEFLKILVFWYALNFVTSSLSYIFYRLKAQRLTLVVDFVHFVIIVASIQLSFSRGLDELNALKVLVACKVALLLSILLITFYLLKKAISKESFT